MNLSDTQTSSSSQATWSVTGLFDEDRFRLILPALLIVVTLVIYSNCYQGQFVLDDRGQSILKNPTFQSLRNLGKILLPPSDATVTSRPLLNLTLAINYRFEGKESTVGYHAVNVAIHIVNCLLLFGLVRQTLRGPRLSDRFGQHATGLAFACALLWVVHPLCTACVTYIVQRAESLMTMFLLATLYCSYKADHSSERSNSWSIMACVICALGMTSKEVMFVAPLIVPFYDWVFGRDSFHELWQRRKNFYRGLAMTWLVLGWTMNSGTRHSVAFNFLGNHPLIDITSWDYAKTQAPIVLHYLSLAFWPHPLVFDYDWPIVQSASEWLPQATVVVGLGLASVWALARRQPIGFVGCFFFLMLGPSSSFLVIYKEIAAEHRMYLPLAALIVTVVISSWSIRQQLLNQVHLPAKCISLCSWGSVVIIAVLLAQLTHQRNFVFHDRLELWRETSSHTPRGARPHNNLGMLYGIRADKLAEQSDKLEQEGQIEQALELSREADDYRQQMIASLRTAIQIKPEYPNAHYNLGRELHALGQLDEAETAYRTAITFFRGRDPRAYDRLGRLLLEQGNLDAALEQFDLAAKAGYAPAQLRYANVLIRQDKYAAAQKRLQQFQRDRNCFQRLAELYALAPDNQVRDGARAIKMADRLIGSNTTSPVSPRDLELRAAALAEQKSFDQAAKIAASLIQHYRQTGNMLRVRIMHQRNQAYQKGRALYWENGSQAN